MQQSHSVRETDRRQADDGQGATKCNYAASYREGRIIIRLRCSCTV